MPPKDTVQTRITISRDAAKSLAYWGGRGRMSRKWVVSELIHFFVSLDREEQAAILRLLDDIDDAGRKAHAEKVAARLVDWMREVDSSKRSREHQR